MAVAANTERKVIFLCFGVYCFTCTLKRTSKQLDRKQHSLKNPLFASHFWHWMGITSQLVRVKLCKNGPTLLIRLIHMINIASKFDFFFFFFPNVNQGTIRFWVFCVNLKWIKDFAEKVYVWIWADRHDSPASLDKYRQWHCAISLLPHNTSNHKLSEPLCSSSFFSNIFFRGDIVYLGHIASYLRKEKKKRQGGVFLPRHPFSQILTLLLFLFHFFFPPLALLFWFSAI